MDLKDFKTETKMLIKTSKGDDKDLIKSLFVTQNEEEVMEEFEKEKDLEIVDELGKKVEVPVVKQGWGDWAGEGVNQDKHLQRVEKIEKLKNQKIADLKKQRLDQKLKGVLISGG